MNEFFSTVNENDLVLRAQEGDHQAFTELVKRYLPRLKGFFERKFFSCEAEDLIQETWIVVWRKIGDFDPWKPGSAFKNFVFKTAMYCGLHEVQRIRNRHIKEDGFEKEQGIKKRQVSVRDIGEIVLDLLERMPRDQAEVLRCYAHGFDQARIHQQTGLKFGKVAALYQIGFKTLRVLLEKEGFSVPPPKKRKPTTRNYRKVSVTAG